MLLVPLVRVLLQRLHRYVSMLRLEAVGQALRIQQPTDNSVRLKTGPIPINLIYALNLTKMLLLLVHP